MPAISTKGVDAVPTPIALMSETAQALTVASIAAAATIIVCVLTALAAFLAAKRQHRRLICGEAIRAATAWKEMVYRVRRRSGADDAQLRNEIHKLQSDLLYYHAWIGNESRYMAVSFQRLVSGINATTDDELRRAWSESPRIEPSGTLSGELDPDVGPNVAAFLRDVRSHLSPWPWRKVAMARRNWKADR